MSRLFFHIVKRMAINFFILFALLYFLGAVIDIIVNLDEFDKAAALISKDNGILSRVVALLKISIDYEGPRLFQVFAYLHGMIAVGAMAFTASAMWKSSEFTAMMSAGISLRKVTIPFLFVTLFISILALGNQEYVLPKVAPSLLLSHNESGQEHAIEFSVPFTPDKSGSLLIAPLLNTQQGELTEPSFLERDEKGRMVRQIQAESAIWDKTSNEGWILKKGRSVNISFDEQTDLVAISSPVELDFYGTELSPQLLTLHRYSQFIGMLGISQLNDMLDSAGTFDAPLLRRHWYSRFASILLNLMAMVIVIPLFVTRDLVVFSKQAVICGGISIVTLFGGAVFMLMPIDGIPSIVSVFLPVLVLLPIALLRLVGIKT